MLLYPVVPLVGLAGYGPQIIKLARTRTIPDSISLSSWYIWTLTWIISLGYAAFVLMDFLLIVTFTLNLICNSIVIGITLYKQRLPVRI